MEIKFVGVYREFFPGNDDKETPSIKDAVRETKGSREDAILAYLESGHLYIGVPDIVADVISEERLFVGHSSLLTDGTWVWHHYLAYFVRNYHLELDPEFIEHVKSRNGKIATESEIDWANLDRHCLRNENAETNNEVIHEG